MSTSQQKALSRHRRARRQAGLVRIEVQAPAIDIPILRDLAAKLRRPSPEAEELRELLRSMISQPRGASAFEIFGSDLPDAAFEGVLDQERRRDPPRDADL